jgi:hypothetical protein
MLAVSNGLPVQLRLEPWVNEKRRSDKVLQEVAQGQYGAIVQSVFEYAAAEPGFTKRTIKDFRYRDPEDIFLINTDKQAGRLLQLFIVIDEIKESASLAAFKSSRFFLGKKVREQISPALYAQIKALQNENIRQFNVFNFDAPQNVEPLKILFKMFHERESANYTYIRRLETDINQLSIRILGVEIKQDPAEIVEKQMERYNLKLFSKGELAYRKQISRSVENHLLTIDMEQLPPELRTKYINWALTTEMVGLISAILKTEGAENIDPSLLGHALTTAARNRDVDTVLWLCKEKFAKKIPACWYLTAFEEACRGNVSLDRANFSRATDYQLIMIDRLTQMEAFQKLSAAGRLALLNRAFVICWQVDACSEVKAYIEKLKSKAEKELNFIKNVENVAMGMVALVIGVTHYFRISS